MSTRTATRPDSPASDALVRRLYESVPLLMGVVETTDDDILHLSDNRAARLFFGQDRTDGRWASEMGVQPDALALWLRWYRHAQAHGGARFEFRTGPRSFSVHVSFLGLADSGRPSFSYVAEELTSQRAAEEEARHQLALTRTITDTAPVAILLTDQAGQISYVNPAAVAMFGFTESEMLGVRAHDLLHARHPDGRPYPFEECPLSRVRSGAVILDHEDTFFRKDGSPVDVACSSAATMREGRFEASVLVLRDVTERNLTRARLREAEQEAARALRAANASLEQRVAERTSALATANEELRAFSYSVSHDLRTPLRAIDAYAAFLHAESDVLDDVHRGYLGRIRAGAQRMGHLIDALLHLSRIGRAELEREPVDLRAVADEVLAELRRAEPHRVVEVTLAPDLHVVGDGRLLRAVMENLLGNAWKYTAVRAVAHVEVLREGDAIRVRDDGVGFDMTHAGLLFEPFQRLHSPGEYEGSGVGLATVARIVRRHGGRIWADSAPDRGATFWFTLG